MDTPADRELARESLSFLVRSAYRVAVLDALAAKPRSRDELREETGVPRITLGRVLTAFEQRGWIEREGHHFRTTLAGDVLAEALESSLDIVETVQTLEDVLEWLPADDLPFDLTHLADAEIILPADGDPLAPVQQAVDWLTEADQVRVVSPVVIAESLAANWVGVTQHGQTFEGVFPSSVIDAIAAHPEMASKLRAMIDSGQADIYQCRCDIPYVVSTTEDVAALPLSDEQGLPQGLIITDDVAVYDWAETLIDSYQARAVRVAADQFSQ